MSLRKYLVRHLHPVLKAKGFTYQKPFWMTDSSQPWRIAVEVKSGKMLDNRWFLELDIGLFSHEIDAITDAKARQFDCSRDQLPLGVITCHFQSSIFSLDEDANWELPVETGPFFDTEVDAEIAIQQMSTKFDTILPRVVQRYARHDAIIDCKNNNIGSGARGKKAGLFAAAACVILKRYDEVDAFLSESIRPGTLSYDKKIGDAISAMIPK